VTGSYWPVRTWGEKRRQAYRKSGLLETAGQCNLRTWQDVKP